MLKNAMLKVIPAMVTWLVVSPSMAQSTSPEQLQSMIESAITRFSDTPLEQWSYRRYRYENEEGEVARHQAEFSPIRAAGDQWRLLSFDDASPTEEQMRTFQKTQAQGGYGGHEVTLKLTELVQADTLRLVDESEDNIIAEFNVHIAKLGEQASEALIGQLHYNKSKKCIEQIKVNSKHGFSAVFTAHIDKLSLNMTFLCDGNAVLPIYQNLTLLGRIAYFFEINEVSILRYSHYQHWPAS